LDLWGGAIYFISKNDMSEKRAATKVKGIAIAVEYWGTSYI
jgi:hypothetical protein